jgi:hypothetical protein
MTATLEEIEETAPDFAGVHGEILYIPDPSSLIPHP